MPVASATRRLAEVTFALGTQMCNYDGTEDFNWILYKKNIILATVNNNQAMISLLKEVFECGVAVAERKRKRSMQNT